MNKSKIAISVDSSLLEQVDLRIDGSIIRSRSQAIEFFLRKGLKDTAVDIAVLLIRGEDHSHLFEKISGKSLLRSQIDFFATNGIKTLYLVTQHSSRMNDVLSEIENSPIQVQIVEQDAAGNADALLGLRETLRTPFVVMSGDTYNNFDLPRMIKKHMEVDNLATMGLMSSTDTRQYGNAVLDGDLIVDFVEKPKIAASNVVNAGIYILKPEVFELFDNVSSLERDLFPKLSKIKQLVGFFTHGQYQHFG